MQLVLLGRWSCGPLAWLGSKPPWLPHRPALCHSEQARCFPWCTWGPVCCCSVRSAVHILPGLKLGSLLQPPPLVACWCHRSPPGKLFLCPYTLGGGCRPVCAVLRCVCPACMPLQRMPAASMAGAAAAYQLHCPCFTPYSHQHAAKSWLVHGMHLSCVRRLACKGGAAASTTAAACFLCLSPGC